MMTLYHIVPKNNGCFYLAKRDNGEYYIIPKDKSSHEELIFDTKTEAQEYIDTNNLTEYTPEWLLRKHRFLCPVCDNMLQIQCTLGCDETASGYSESLASCTNNKCELDWNIKRTDDGKVISIERHFWG